MFARKLLFTVFVSALTTVGCATSDTEPENGDTELVDPAREAVERLAEEYQASSEWREGLKYTYDTYTIELQRALLGGEPVLVRANLSDIARWGERYVAYFEPVLLDPLKLHLELQCDEAIASRLLEHSVNELHPRNPFSAALLWEFVLVARIQNVGRPRFSVTAIHPEGWPDALVNVEEADFFVASGELLDFEIVPSKLMN